MAATAAGFGRAHIIRIARGDRRNRRVVAGPYIAPDQYIAASTSDLWRSPRRFSR
jgi:hypothetical protein